MSGCEDCGYLQPVLEMSNVNFVDCDLTSHKRVMTRHEIRHYSKFAECLDSELLSWFQTKNAASNACKETIGVAQAAKRSKVHSGTLKKNV